MRQTISKPFPLASIKMKGKSLFTFKHLSLQTSQVRFFIYRTHLKTFASLFFFFIDRSLPNTYVSTPVKGVWNSSAAHPTLCHVINIAFHCQTLFHVIRHGSIYRLCTHIKENTYGWACLAGWQMGKKLETKHRKLDSRCGWTPRSKARDRAIGRLDGEWVGSYSNVNLNIAMECGGWRAAVRLRYPVGSGGEFWLWTGASFVPWYWNAPMEVIFSIYKQSLLYWGHSGTCSTVLVLICSIYFC